MVGWGGRRRAAAPGRCPGLDVSPRWAGRS